MKNHTIPVLVAAVAIPLAILAGPFVSKAQFLPWQPAPARFEYFCNGTWQNTPCSSISSSRTSSTSSSRSSTSSSRPYEYFCNGTWQSTPCSSSLSSSSLTGSGSCPVPVTLFSDLSVILDTDQATVGAAQTVTYSVKVRNGGTNDVDGATVFLLRNDMTYMQSSAFCFVQATDPTYVRCTVPPVLAGQAATFTVTLQTAPDFTCIDSTGGRSVFAFVRARAGGNEDLYPQNNTSNIVNTMPRCL